MTYSVKELFYTLQGEGANTGRPAVFCRFSGCNLWSGREEDRASAICDFCDTDFVGTDGDGGGKFADPKGLADAAAAKAPGDCSGLLLVCTGGEPLLQLDAPLIDAFHEAGFEIAIETNGTIAVPDGPGGPGGPSGIDWVCVSPKADAPLAQTSGDEIKLVFPQEKARPERFEDLDFTHFFLQPMDGPARTRNTKSAVAYCLEHPRWRLSLQTHKFIGIA